MKKILSLLFICFINYLTLTAQTNVDIFQPLAQISQKSKNQLVHLKQSGTKVMEIDKQKSVIKLNSPELKKHTFRSIKIFPEDLKIKAFNIHFISDNLFDNDDELEFLLAYKPNNDSLRIDLFKSSGNGIAYIIKNLAKGKGEYNIKISREINNTQLEIVLGEENYNYNLNNNCSLVSRSKKSSFPFTPITGNTLKIANPFSRNLGKIEILMFSNSGKLIKTRTVSGRKPKVSLKLTKIPTGKYICQLKNKFGIAQTHYFEIVN